MTMRTCRYCEATIYPEKSAYGRIWVDAEEGGTYDLCEENWLDDNEQGPHRPQMVTP